MTRTHTPTRVPQQRRPCPAWCAAHDPIEGYCIAADTAVPCRTAPGQPSTVSMTSHPDSGILIDLYRDPDTPLTLDDAEHLAYALLAKVTAARQGVTA